MPVAELESVKTMKVRLSPAEDIDFEFAFEAKHQAFGPYVEARWGWEDSFQHEVHRKRWTERPWSIIVYGDQKVGTVSVACTTTHIQFGEFYLLPRFQRQGIGTEVLHTVLQQADTEGLPVRLEYLKGNPAGSLYKRHGFAIVAENESHYFLVRSSRKC